MDDRNEKMGYKIRQAQVNKIPYTLVVGDNEDEQTTMAFDEFVTMINHDIETYSRED